MKVQTKNFLVMSVAVAVGVYLGMSVIPALLPPSKLTGG